MALVYFQRPIANHATSGTIVPLVGLGLPLIFDKKLLCHDFVYGGPGDELVTLKIKPEDLMKANEITGIFE